MKRGDKWDSSPPLLKSVYLWCKFPQLLARQTCVFTQDKVVAPWEERLTCRLLARLLFLFHVTATVE